MDRNIFAACAVLVLPLAALSVGCDAKPDSPSRSVQVAPPAVLAELQSFTPSPWRDLANVPNAAAEPPAAEPVAEAPSEPADLPSEPIIVSDESGDMRFVITVPPTEDPDMRFVVDVPPADSADANSPDALGMSKSADIRTVPAPSATESLDAPIAPEPEVQSPSDNSAANVMPDTETEARIVPPSAGVTSDAPLADDFPMLEPEAPAQADIPTPQPPSPKHTDIPALKPQTPVHTDLPTFQPQAPALVEQPSPMSPLPAGAAPAPRSELPWANAGPRSPEMISVVQRADGRVQHAFQLAERGALYSARAEFVAALQLLAQANDAQQNTRLYTKALTAGLVALKESSDFVRPIAGTSEIDVSRLITAHKTPILKEIPVSQLAPIVAAQRYYSYAQEHLAAAAAQEMCGSMALFGLAKVAIGSAGNNKSQQLERTAQAMTLYQAALIAAPKNFLAANELAVLLADNGNLARARDLLIRAASLSPQAITWENLAAVHARLGESALADHARAEASALRDSGRGLPPALVQQVDPETFASTAPVSDTVLPAVTPVNGPAPAASAPTSPHAETARKGISDWLPWNSRR